MSSSCCSTSSVAKAHLHHALGSAPSSPEPAHHAQGATAGEHADLLVVGRISTGDPDAWPEIEFHATYLGGTPAFES